MMRLTLTTIEPDERAELARCLDAASLPSADIAETGRLRRLHLPTTPLVPLFRALGDADIDRGAAPAAVAASREFTALCPASAAYLVKAL